MIVFFLSFHYDDLSVLMAAASFLQKECARNSRMLLTDSVFWCVWKTEVLHLCHWYGEVLTSEAKLSLFLTLERQKMWAFHLCVEFLAWG